MADPDMDDELTVVDARARLYRDMDDDAKAAAWARRFGKAALDALEGFIGRGYSDYA